MDEIIEVEVVENFFNFENALKRIQKEFEKKKVQNFHLFNVLDLRSKWTEIEINKYTDNNGINFYQLSKEDIFIKDLTAKINNGRQYIRLAVRDTTDNNYLLSVLRKCM